MEPVFHYGRTGYSFDVYNNRIEIAERGLLTTTKTTILLKMVANVELVGIMKKLKITTLDKKAHEFMLGTEAPQARDAILAQM